MKNGLPVFASPKATRSGRPSYYLRQNKQKVSEGQKWTNSEFDKHMR